MGGENGMGNMDGVSGLCDTWSWSILYFVMRWLYFIVTVGGIVNKAAVGDH